MIIPLHITHTTRIHSVIGFPFANSRYNHLLSSICITDLLEGWTKDIQKAFRWLISVWNCSNFVGILFKPEHSEDGQAMNNIDGILTVYMNEYNLVSIWKVALVGHGSVRWLSQSQQRTDQIWLQRRRKQHIQVPFLLSVNTYVHTYTFIYIPFLQIQLALVTNTVCTPSTHQ